MAVIGAIIILILVSYFVYLYINYQKQRKLDEAQPTQVALEYEKYKMMKQMELEAIKKQVEMQSIEGLMHH